MGARGPSSRSPSPDFLIIENILRQDAVLSRSKITATAPLPDHLHRIYQVYLSNGKKLILKGQPSHRVRVLRHEQYGLATEATCLRFLSTATSIPLPRLVHYQAPLTTLPSQPFTLSTGVPGVSLSSWTHKISQAQLDRVHRGLGKELRKLCGITARTFGPIHRVRDGRGWSTWRGAFTWMMEAVLCDCEDGLVNLPYEAMREFLNLHGDALDEITEASLIRMDPFDEQKVFVDKDSCEITGLIGWTHVVWGDPCAMDVLVRNPSTALLEGFGELPFALPLEGSRKRQLLYLLYHAVKAVATQCHRPSSDEHERDGRKRLTWALMQLANI